jgi:hypothetical protein
MSGSCHGDPALGRRKRGERKSRDLHTHGLDEPMGTDSTDAILISEDAGKITGFQLISPWRGGTHQRSDFSFDRHPSVLKLPAGKAVENEQLKKRETLRSFVREYVLV